ncbi:MAG: hypothetical protein AB7I18_00120 [Candidatus Berkiella sp.]
MMKTVTYPWLVKITRRLEDMVRAHQFPHAILIAGQEGLGQQALISGLSQLLLCLSPQNNKACGACRACHLFVQGYHPDYRHLGENQVNISIDDVREVIGFLSQASHQGGNRVIVIAAGNLNVPCANALLKILEEPPENSFFILEASHPSAVIATVRSRCVVIDLPVPAHTQALSWLQQQCPNESLSDLTWRLRVCGGMPLKAEQMKQEILAKSQDFLEDILCSENLSSFYSADVQRWLLADPKEALYLLYYYVTELILYLATGTTVFTNKHKEQLGRLAQLPLSGLLVFLETVLSGIQALRQSGVNKQLLFESLFYQWHALRNK